MLRIVFLSVFGSLLLASCISPETQARIDRAAQDVTILRSQLGVAIDSGASQSTITQLQARLDAAELKLSTLEDQGREERQKMSGDLQGAIVKGDYIGAGVIAIGAILTALGGVKGVKKITNTIATKKEEKLAKKIKEVVSTTKTT